MRRDQTESAKWFLKGARQSDSLYTKEAIEKLEKKMTPEQIAKAKETAKIWNTEK